jgi:release factor glutamine methyltransferase
MNQIISDNSIKAMMEYLENKLHIIYDERESRNIVFRLFEHYLNLPKAEVILRKQERISESEMLQLHFALKRLLQHEPLQYIIGYEYFRSLKFEVNSSVLIPRPETEELVQVILNDHPSSTSFLNLLDIGTGSGCIPISIKKERPNWNVSALDVSSEAIETAKRNAQSNECEVNFFIQDILEEKTGLDQVKIIVSNPPYIPHKDRSAMRENVLQYEPHLALFVEDNEPLLFYKKIISKAMISNTLPMIYFEIHENLKEELADYLDSMGIKHYEFIKDLQEKYRILRIKL